jgi:hypothetical protein
MRRSRAVVVWAGVAAVTLVLAHEAVFLAGYGARFASALVDTGHDWRWTRAVVAVLTLGLVLAIAAVWRLHELGALARAAGASGRRDATARGELTLSALGRPLLRVWLGLSVSTAVLFVIQENIERVGVGLPVVGLAVLWSPEYPHSLSVVLLVAFLVALVVAIFQWRRDALTARIAAGRSRWPRQSDASRPREPATAWRPASILGRRQALRAPPLLTA